MKINVPLRLDISGSYTDLPGYREKGGMHIATPLDYYVHIYSPDTGEKIYEFEEALNYRVTEILRAIAPYRSSKHLTSRCDLKYGSGLGVSSAIVVGYIQWYMQFSESFLQPEEVARYCCRVIEQTSICGRQDEFCAAFARPIYLYYNNKATEAQTFEWPAEFRRNIETWNLLYIPRTISCQEMLEYEMNANLDIEPIVYFTKLMFKAIQQADWNEFWKWYVAHWKFVEEQNPRKINDEIRELRKQYAGIYIRPCGAGAGGYLLVHGEITGVEESEPLSAFKEVSKVKLLP